MQFNVFNHLLLVFSFWFVFNSTIAGSRRFSKLLVLLVCFEVAIFVVISSMNHSASRLLAPYSRTSPSLYAPETYFSQNVWMYPKILHSKISWSLAKSKDDFYGNVSKCQKQDLEFDIGQGLHSFRPFSILIRWPCEVSKIRSYCPMA